MGGWKDVPGDECVFEEGGLCLGDAVEGSDVLLFLGFFLVGGVGGWVGG